MNTFSVDAFALISRLDLGETFVGEVPADADAEQDEEDCRTGGNADHDALVAGQFDWLGVNVRAVRLNVTGRSWPVGNITTPTSGRVWQKRAPSDQRQERKRPSIKRRPRRLSGRSTVTCSTPSAGQPVRGSSRWPSLRPL